jgi:hypothetical protein
VKTLATNLSFNSRSMDCSLNFSKLLLMIEKVVFLIVLFRERARPILFTVLRNAIRNST